MRPPSRDGVAPRLSTSTRSEVDSRSRDTTAQSRKRVGPRRNRCATSSPAGWPESAVSRSQRRAWRRRPLAWRKAKIGASSSCSRCRWHEPAQALRYRPAPRGKARLCGCQNGGVRYFGTHVDLAWAMARIHDGVVEIVSYFLAPYVAATVIFSVLVWAKDPPRFGQTWTIGVIAGAVIGTFAFVGYVTHRRGIRTGPWRGRITDWL